MATYGDYFEQGVKAASKGAYDLFNWTADKVDTGLDYIKNIETPEKGLYYTEPGNYFTQDNWNLTSNNDTGMTLIPEGVYESDYFKDTPAGPVPDIFKPSVPVISESPVYGPINNPNPVLTTPIDWASADPWHEMGSPNLDWNSGADPFNQANNYYTGTGTGIDTADDRFRREAAANLKRNTGNTTSNDPTGKLNITFGGGGGGGSSASAPSAPASLSQDLSQRPLSGTYYAPDLSAYNDSSLFNYTGPGGLSEYIYGQGLPYQGAGYDIWGTPTDMVNPYYTGQFATEQAAGVADGAISLPPVDMPAGVSATNNNPNVGTSNSNIVPQGTGPGGKDLTYQETLDYFNLNPYAQSTTFPSPAGANPSLFDRQLAEMSPEQIARMNQILADETRMQQGQLVSGFKDEEKLNRDVQKVTLDSYDPMQEDFYPYTDPYVGDAGRGTIVEQPGDRSNPLDRFSPAEIAALEARAANAVTAEDLRDGLFAYERDPNFNYYDAQGKQGNIVSDPEYSMSNDAFTLNMLPQRNNENVGDDGNLINRTPPERSIWKEDEINIPTPFKPAGEEGVDYWQSTQGGYYSVDDDLGLEPLTMSQPFSAEEAAERARVEAELYWDDSPKIDLDVAANKVGTPITVTRTPAPAMTNVGPAGSGVIPPYVAPEVSPSIFEKAYDFGGILDLPSAKDIAEEAYDWGGVLNLPSARDIYNIFR